MKAFLCELILSCVLAVPTAKTIDELTYGTVLYAYFQRDYQQALLDTLVAEKQGRRGENTLRFDLAKGSFAFNDGMYAYARKIFEQVDAEELSELDRMRLAFHLAREYHRRQDWSQLAVALAEIDLGRTWSGKEKFHPEVEYMRAEVAMEKGDFSAAQRSLDALEPQDPLRAYTLFNLGVAYKEAGDSRNARNAFTELAEMKPYSDEASDLIQRAKLALAFIARQTNNLADARSVLGGLPGEGRYRDIALASYGELAMDNEDYQLAARIWLTLQTQDYWTSSTAAARLGFPLSLERMASQDMALERYRAAEKSFETRLETLNQLTAKARDSSWVRAILKVFSAPEQDRDQMSDLMESWRDQLGHTDWLEWLATEDVHEVLLQWRELLAAKSWLDNLPRRLAVFQEISEEQRRRGVEARTLLHESELLNNRERLAAEIEDLRERLAALEVALPKNSVAWMLTLANADERELIGELAEMSRVLSRNGSTKNIGEKRHSSWEARINRLQGVVFWRLVDGSSVRIRGLVSDLGHARTLLADVDERIFRVEEAESRYVASVETEFVEFSERARDITRRVDAALIDREERLAAEIRNGMNRERAEVEQHLLITRIAIARATDRLAQVASAASDPSGDGT
ncbi:MAG: hypothetical protein O7G86_11000 [Gammaproteobacteria bacterium]|nr:hypothetical protein [Gammaproteobacteria bacterium]